MLECSLEFEGFHKPSENRITSIIVCEKLIQINSCPRGRNPSIQWVGDRDDCRVYRTEKLPLACSRTRYRLRGDQPVPDKQNDHCTDSRGDEARPLIRPVPSNRLADPGRKKRARNTEDHSQDEARWVIRSWRKPSRNDARHKTNQNNPENTHASSSW
jgi:hypothetical protein